MWQPEAFHCVAQTMAPVSVMLAGVMLFGRRNCVTRPDLLSGSTFWRTLSVSRSWVERQAILAGDWDDVLHVCNGDVSSAGEPMAKNCNNC